jgi:hypothetical protein
LILLSVFIDVENLCVEHVLCSVWVEPEGKIDAWKGTDVDIVVAEPLLHGVFAFSVDVP